MMRKGGAQKMLNEYFDRETPQPRPQGSLLTCAGISGPLASRISRPIPIGC